MEIIKRQCFLAFEGDGMLDGHRVAVVPALDSLLHRWSPTSRVSPIFCVAGAGIGSPNRLEFKGVHYLVLAGPIPPEEIHPLLGKHVEAVWLSLGLRNLIVDVRSAADLRVVRRFLDHDDRRLSYEIWHVKNGNVRAYSHSPARPTSSVLRKGLADMSRLQPPEEIAEALQEYCPLMASTISRSEQSVPGILPGLTAFHEEIEKTVRELAPSASDDAKYRALSQLIYVNAGLSRFSSQTLAGTTPIAETACHFWSNSLLGIGIASLALWRLCRFIERTLGEARIPERFAKLKCISRDIPDLPKLSIRDKVWSSDHLGGEDLDSASLEPIVPLLPFYSARDGFRSNLTTISAPLATVSACNTHQWSLLTLTHEISHLVVRGVLGELYPDIEEDKEMRNALQLIELKQVGGTFFEEIRRYMLFSIVKMDDVAHQRDEAKEWGLESLEALLEGWHHEVEEILAQVFDFLYFYGRDVKTYVTGIWTSWGTIPTINERVRDYVVRTVCAVVAPQLRKGVLGIEIARKQIRDCLATLKKENIGTGVYIERALRYLEAHWDDEIKDRVYARLPLVKIVSAFLFSEALATVVRAETEISGGAGDKEGYKLRQGHFDGRNIRNPVRFLELYTRSKDASPDLSAWILYVLAFRLEEHGRRQSPLP